MIIVVLVVAVCSQSKVTVATLFSKSFSDSKERQSFRDSQLT